MVVPLLLYPAEEKKKEKKQSFPLTSSRAWVSNKNYRTTFVADYPKNHKKVADQK